MKSTLKKYFIPHQGNNYHPHILHTKRTIFYSALAVASKAIVMAFVLAVPSTVFVLPDVIAPQEAKVFALVNELRMKEGKEPLTKNVKLNGSASLKATEMADTQTFSHTGPTGHSLVYFLKQTGYAYSVAGENLAMGFSDAEELFDAWVKSPKHYDNIVDADYLETGLGISAGLFNDIPTVYVAEHFGMPKKVATVPVVAEVVSPPPPPISQVKIATIPKEQILSEKSQAKPVVVAMSTPIPTNTVKENVAKEIVPEAVVYDPTKSQLIWEEVDGQLKLTATAYVAGEVKTVSAEVKDYKIELLPSGDNNIYVGSIMTKESADEFFKVVFPADVFITPKDGEAFVGSMAWQSVKIVSPSVLEKYTLAKKTLGPITGIFALSRNIYLGLLIFFTFALFLNIVVAIRRQHHHVIAQTLGLIGLLVLFYVV
jgi:uncharacterized protein YkwD